MYEVVCVIVSTGYPLFEALEFQYFQRPLQGLFRITTHIFLYTASQVYIYSMAVAIRQKIIVALVSRPVMQYNFSDQTKHFPGLSRTTFIFKYFQGLDFAALNPRTRGYPCSISGTSSSHFDACDCD